MDQIIGKIAAGKVTDENDHFYFVQIEGATFQLDKKEIQKPLKLGSNFKGFTYENEAHKMQITRTAPKTQIDHYAFGEVVGFKHDLGIFVNIGLPNKDVAVSLDDLPTIRSIWPSVGDHLMIALKVDKKGRIWGQLADEEIFNAIAKPANNKMMNKNVQATVYRDKLAGTKVITDDYHLGFVHPNEREVEPRLGQHVSGRVIGVHPDGTLNLSLKPRAYEAISGDAAMIFAVLKHDESGQLPYTDKSDPKDIKKFFGISKGQFKRAVGALLKQRLVTEDDQFLKLTEKGISKDVE
ncbi:S1 RNA-binding domain-containing protein [Lactobacillus sp. Sy-1]|uniref:CvfB family protein n=1 Tax=Lactobacillus sp. Sy-1 TaxID=2109645 RepID=UPI001C576FC2|nr:S1-like domain-containing RNA-binding protein [Lactobacillus sp. Sy-1]MBW1605538.1 DNA-binding protein [Lactobacillus sp. Sy-1]